jgi:hypothetical protein
MKKLILIVLVALLVINTLYLFKNSFYSPDFDLIVCHNQNSCLHEMGHQLDNELGNISKSKEFQLATLAYIKIIWDYPQFRDTFSNLFIGYSGITSPYQDENRIIFKLANNTNKWGGYSELYADIFAYVNGDISKIPEFFRGFYERRINE